MKAISMWQPWASAVAFGLKKIETRGWSTTHRGEIAIHASKRWTRDEREAAKRLGVYDGQPPLGVVVAVARLVDVREMDQAWIDQQTQQEIAFGVWSPGRFGWVLDDVVPVEPHFPALGRQGLFTLGLGDAEEIRARAETVRRRSGAYLGRGA